MQSSHFSQIDFYQLYVTAKKKTNKYINHVAQFLRCLTALLKSN